MSKKRKPPKRFKPVGSAPAGREWKLAPLSGCEPRKLVTAEKGQDEALSGLLLALALAFNDLKSLLVLLEQVERVVPEGERHEITPAGGQYGGVAVFVWRFAMSLVKEIFELLKEHAPLLESGGVIHGYVKTLPEASQVAWRLLLNDALETGDGSKKLTGQLARIRAQTYHYYQPNGILSGFREHFYRHRPSPQNSRAYASIGDRAEATRFHFADAAGLGVVSDAMREEAASVSRLLVITVNEALGPLLAAWFRERARDAEPSE